MNGPEAHWLPDGRRLHLNHGPIDLIVEAFGNDSSRQAAFRAAVGRFRTILGELVEELSELRRPVGKMLRDFTGATARRMEAAVCPLSEQFITPMAAVAGSVADEILAAMIQAADLDRAYVNNGGDIALHLAPGRTITLAVAGTGNGFADRVVLHAEDGVRGVATSGWRGRSFSLGIADAVTVLARTGAEADAAATIIANAVDLPGHPAIARTPAAELAPDSDLGMRLVTTAVGDLTPAEVAAALDAGRAVAEDMRRRGLIIAAAFFLNGETRAVGEVGDVSASREGAGRAQMAKAALLRTPLCPAGHLPRKGGDRLSSVASPIVAASKQEPAEMKANLPPCGGDVRQDRGGWEGSRLLRVAAPAIRNELHVAAAPAAQGEKNSEELHA